jgi:putative endonuclease
MCVIPACFWPESRRQRLGKPMDKRPAVYILASKRNGTLYIGVTSDLLKRVWEHRNSVIEGFTKRYGIHSLVWYELHERMESALQREKRMKEWARRWKVRLIEKMNPTWRDLYPSLLGLDSGQKHAGMTKNHHGP